MARPQAPVGAPKPPTQDEDYRTRLLAAREALEGQLAAAGPREYAPLMARYLDILDRVRELPEVKESDVVDDLTARRARSAATSRQQRPAAG